mgnify:CR=1 FL=1
MKWVTRDYVHLDRVASPWLITRFIDSQAEVVFIPWDGSVAPPVDATPFGVLSSSEGTIYRTSDDRAVLAASFPIYDALYADLQVRQALQSDGTRPPAPGRPGPGDKIDFLRALYRRIA